jgi:hypothetical protein
METFLLWRNYQADSDRKQDFEDFAICYQDQQNKAAVVSQERSKTIKKLFKELHGITILIDNPKATGVEYEKATDEFNQAYDSYKNGPKLPAAPKQVCGEKPGEK